MVVAGACCTCAVEGTGVLTGEEVEPLTCAFPEGKTGEEMEELTTGMGEMGTGAVELEGMLLVSKPLPTALADSTGVST